MEIHFGPGFINPEEMARQRAEMMQQLINDKKCVVCKNTYLINDQITMCHISNECVDSTDGLQCKHWEPLQII